MFFLKFHSHASEGEERKNAKMSSCFSTGITPSSWSYSLILKLLTSASSRWKCSNFNSVTPKNKTDVDLIKWRVPSCNFHFISYSNSDFAPCLKAIHHHRSKLVLKSFRTILTLFVFPRSSQQLMRVT